MKYQKKSFFVLALAGLVTMLMAGTCGGDKDKDKETEDEFNYTDVKATLWKNLKKDAANFDNGTVTEVVVSGKNTYVGTSDQGLWVSEKGGDWKKVDLSKGIAPAAAAGSAAVAEVGKHVAHLTALSGDRVIFAVVDGTKSVIIAEGAVAKRTMAPSAGKSPEGDKVKSILAAKGADDKERIFVADGLKVIFMQLDSADDQLKKDWDVSLQASDKAFDAGTKISQLRLNFDGSALVFSKDDLNGYDTIAKAEWKNGGKAAKADGAVSFKGDNASAVWKAGNMPTDIQFTEANKAVFAVGKDIGYASDLTTGANAAVALNPAPTAVNKLMKDSVVDTKVKVLAKEGVFTVNGTDGTAAAANILAGDNFMDEGKTVAQLEAMKAKTELTAADLGTKDIKDVAKSAAAKATYLVTDKGLSVGVEKELKLNKTEKKQD